MFAFDDLYFAEENFLDIQDIFLTEEESNHLIRVKRAKTGTRVFITNGMGSLIEGYLSGRDRKKAHIHIENISNYPKTRNFEIFLAVSQLKRSSFEFMLEKVTELGVDVIIPLLTERSVANKDKPERWNKVITSALKQSKRVWKPRLDPLSGLTLLKDLYPDVSWICFHEKAETFFTPESISPKGNKIGVLIGPEGGFSEKEIKPFEKRYLLSDARLRAETAAIAAVCQIESLYRWI